VFVCVRRELWAHAEAYGAFNKVTITIIIITITITITITTIAAGICGD
jgi:hypothetical protein